MKKLNKIISGALAALMIVTSVPIYAINDLQSDNTEITSEITELTEETTETSEILKGTIENNSETSELNSNESESNSETTEVTSLETTEETLSDETSSEQLSEEIISQEEITEVTEKTTTTEETSEIPEDTTTIPSNEELNILEIDEDDEEITDPLYGWDVSLLLYDQDEGNGKIGKTELDWYPTFEANSNGANNSNSASKTISMQINYKNTVAPMDYEAGTLLFIVPNLAYQYNSLYGQSTNLSVTITTGANDGLHAGYDWDFLGYDNDMSETDKTADSGTAYMIFTNAKDIEAGKTFEGSIQIRYAITSNSESAEVDLDECIHSFEKDFKAYMMTQEDFNSIRSGFYGEYYNIQTEEINKLKESMDYNNKTQELADAVTDIKNQIEEASDEIKTSFDESKYTDFIQSPGYPEKGNTSMSQYKDFNNIKTNGDNVVLVFTNDSLMYSTTSREYIKVRDLNTGEIIDTIDYSTLKYQKVYVYEDTNNIRLEYYVYTSSYCYPFKAYVFSSDEEQYLNMGTLTTKKLETIKAQTDFNNEYNNEYAKITSSDYLTKLTYEKYFENKKEEVNMLTTNNIKLDYERTYLHPWKKYTHTLKETANPITTTDNLPENNEDYIWVRYNFTNNTNYYYSASYPYKYIYYSYPTIYTTFPDKVVVYNYNGDKIEQDLDGRYALPKSKTYKYNSSGSTYYYETEIYVGYPKSIYNEKNGNLTITNTSELWGPYGSSTANQEYAATDSVTFDLSEFEFKYSTGIISIGKSYISNTGSDYAKFYYQYLNKDSVKGQKTQFYITPNLRNDNKIPYTLKVGDDMLYATNKDGVQEKLTDNDYYFTTIYFPTLYSNSNMSIPSNTYDCELWIRYANEENYVLFEQFKNTSKSWSSSSFTKPVVGYYFLIKDLTTGISSSTSRGYFYNYVYFKKADDNLAETGILYNFALIQLYTKDDEGNLTWINKASLENYSTEMTQMKIAEYDLKEYGGYVQRATAKRPWTYLDLNLPVPYTYVTTYSTSSNQNIQNEAKQEFTGQLYGRTYIRPNTSSAVYYEYDPALLNNYAKEKMIKGHAIYTLLPKGMECRSTEKEIIEKLKYDYTSSTDITLVDENGNQVLYKDLWPYIQEHATVKITENWKGTGRTRIEINLNFDKNYWVFYPTGYSSLSRYIYFYINYAVSYDSYIEYGSSYTWNCYSAFISDTCTQSNGSKDTQDINENGSTTDYVSSDSASTSFVSVISTHQDIEATVMTDQSDYTPKSAYASNDSTYTYKLRVRTGQNDIKDLVIKDNLEMAFGERDYWQGEFLGVNTSYVEGKTFYYYDPSDPNANASGMVSEKIDIVTYYSTDPNELDLFETELKEMEDEEGNLVGQTVYKRDADGNKIKNTNWKVYNDSVDKSTVKSLAFEFLKAGTNEPAIIPSNSIVYVLINLQSPEDEKITTLAYNNCSTQWTAIDFTGEEMPYITGITSNRTKVLLPNSIDADSIPSIQLNISKEIQGTAEAFENMQLDPNGEYQFKISLVKQEENEDGTHDIINGIVSNKKGLVIKNLHYGTWLIKESDDTYFDFVDIVSMMDEEIMVEGVTFEKTKDGYLLTISDDVDTDSFYEIKVINEIEPEKFYEDKDSKVNLFKESPIIEEQSLLDKLIDFFK